MSQDNSEIVRNDELVKSGETKAVRLVDSMYRVPQKDFDLAALFSQLNLLPVPKLSEYLLLRQETMFKGRNFAFVDKIEVDVQVQESFVKDGLLHLGIGVKIEEYYIGSKIPGEKGFVVWMILSPKADARFELVDFMSHDAPELIAFGAEFRPDNYDRHRWQGERAEQAIKQLGELRDRVTP